MIFPKISLEKMLFNSYPRIIVLVILLLNPYSISQLNINTPPMAGRNRVHWVSYEKRKTQTDTGSKLTSKCHSILFCLHLSARLLFLCVTPQNIEPRAINY